eukprot:ANDGO_03552.mRNA.1 hypothetical protein
MSNVLALKIEYLERQLAQERRQHAEIVAHLRDQLDAERRRCLVRSSSSSSSSFSSLSTNVRSTVRDAVCQTENTDMDSGTKLSPRVRSSSPSQTRKPLNSPAFSRSPVAQPAQKLPAPAVVPLPPAAPAPIMLVEVLETWTQTDEIEEDVVVIAKANAGMQTCTKYVEPQILLSMFQRHVRELKKSVNEKLRMIAQKMNSKFASQISAQASLDELQDRFDQLVDSVFLERLRERSVVETVRWQSESRAASAAACPAPTSQSADPTDYAAENHVLRKLCEMQRRRIHGLEFQLMHRVASQRQSATSSP